MARSSMPKPSEIRLVDGTSVPILYEDRNVLAIDKPSGWWLDHESRDSGRNLHRELLLQIHAGEFWAKSRGIRFLRYLHRLDAGTSGVLLWSRSPGGVAPYSELFASGGMHKIYFAVTDAIPTKDQWTCDLPIAPDPRRPGAQHTSREGKEAETRFRLLEKSSTRGLVEAIPLTGRTHQIRVHLAEVRCPVVNDRLYGATASEPSPPPRGRRNVPDDDSQEDAIGLRAMELSYRDPFLKKPVRIRAPMESFLRFFGFPSYRPEGSRPAKAPISSPGLSTDAPSPKP